MNSLPVSLIVRHPLRLMARDAKNSFLQTRIV